MVFNLARLISQKHIGSWIIKRRNITMKLYWNIVNIFMGFHLFTFIYCNVEYLQKYITYMKASHSTILDTIT